MRNTKTKLAALSLALCLLAPIRLHAQTEAYPNTDANGGHYRDYDGGKLFEDGGTSGTFGDLSRQFALDSANAAARGDAARGLMRNRYGVVLTLDECKKRLADALPACQFPPDPDAEARALAGLSHGHTVQQTARDEALSKACLDRVQTLGKALGLPRNDVGLPYGVAVYDAYAIRDGVKKDTTPGVLYTLSFLHYQLAGKKSFRGLSDESKQEAYTNMVVVAGTLDLMLGALVRHDAHALSVLKVAGPVPTLAQARQLAYGFLKGSFVTDVPDQWHLTPAGLFQRGPAELTFRSGMWFAKKH